MISSHLYPPEASPLAPWLHKPSSTAVGQDSAQTLAELTDQTLGTDLTNQKRENGAIKPTILGM